MIGHLLADLARWFVDAQTPTMKAARFATVLVGAAVAICLGAFAFVASFLFVVQWVMGLGVIWAAPIAVLVLLWLVAFAMGLLAEKA